ncbi:DNA-3-methyladenine glycosylase [Dyadobacter sp. CY323]|uniref:DNA-3-methyladenine glycosylase n=1 Tax=Dyadobacter sp. CY323 TaxID=2907302 RepID=UPI001F24EC38|nr:DNA-3-methyladenine glycosylase [Dyadobacter sp. CY323]MCE6987867.1 DNA-3-methyladenine glycosylase [Dyadobacter sp. CY323]
MPSHTLPASFFQQYDTKTLAQKLLGCELVHDSPDGATSGIIVETEAYLQDDPACHAYNKRTTRTEPMYGPPGTIYIYLIYGMYECFNIVSNREDVGEAVLIRALQPTSGTELMEQRRLLIPGKVERLSVNKKVSLKDLCRGPGKLVRAMGINRAQHNSLHLSNSPVYITPPVVSDFEIVTTTRIGINVGTDLQYRYYIKNNLFVSKLG